MINIETLLDSLLVIIRTAAFLTAVNQASHQLILRNSQLNHKDEKKEKFDSLGVNAPEIVPTQAMRQEAFDNWETTDI